MAKNIVLVEQELTIRADQNSAALQREIDSIQANTVTAAQPRTTSSIDNLLDDSDLNFSDAAYTTAGVLSGDAGDGNNRAYNWYRIERATALLVADDTHSLKGASHSAFGSETTDTPRWSKTDGWAEIGGTSVDWDMCCPLPNNFVSPGMRYYFQILARLRTATALPDSIKLFAELYDNTSSVPDGLPAVITGSAFTLDGNTFGTVGATSRAYKLVVQTDYGDEIESTVKTVADAPSTLTPSNGVRLSWPRFPGFTNVDIYVTVGGNSFLVGKIGDGASSFLDVGQTLRAVTAVPTASTTKPRAYAETQSIVPTLDWREYDLSIIVPQTYNFGKTTGKQWLRIGVIGALGEGHQLEIDRIGLSTGYGLWSISSNDRNAKSLPSSTQNGSTQGPPSGIGPPPGDGGGGERGCAVLDTLYLVCDEDGSNEREMELRDIEVDMFVVGRVCTNRVLHVHRKFATETVMIRTENGHGRRCSLSDLWVLGPDDSHGRAANLLSVGMSVETQDGPSPIVEYTLMEGAEVGLLSTDGDHIMTGGGASQHNRKFDEIMP